MSKGGLFVLASQFAPSVLRIRPGTWLAIAVGLMGFVVIVVWAAYAVFSWLWGQGKSLTDGVPETVSIITSQVEKAVPGAREALGDLVPALKPEPPQRDVSGTDIGPVPRYSGLARSHWHRDGREITVRYEGRADYVAVLDHYAKGFVAQGYTQNVISATPEGEEHDYRKNNERVGFKIAQLPQGKVKTTVVATLP